MSGQADHQAFGELLAARTLIRYLDVARGVDAIAQFKRRTFALLELRRGDRVLDVGCGTGEDVCALAELVGPGGRAVGVDTNPWLVGEARRRAMGRANVTFQLGDACELAFPDGAFDGCRAERVLMHLDHPGRALAAMTRVVRPGGRIVVTEPDFGTLVVHGADPTVARRVAEVICSRYRAGRHGRELRELFLRQGLVEVVAEPATVTLASFHLANQLFHLRAGAEAACARGLLTEDEAIGWVEALARADGVGCFSCALTGYVVRGRRPGRDQLHRAP